MPDTREPLRIALLDSIPEWGGGQKWDLQTARGLGERGHFVAIVCTRGGALEARARQAGFPVWSAPLDRFGGRLANALSLARFLRREHVGSVIANVGRDVRLGALVAWLAGATLLQRRGLLRPLGRGWFTQWLYRHHVRRVIVNSEALQRLLRESAPWLGPRLALLPNAIDPAFLAGDGQRLRIELGIGASVPLVGAVGRLAPMKGFEHLLAAWPAVRVAQPEAELVLFGDGELRGSLREQAARLGITDSIHLAGFREDVEALYETLDVFVLPSLRDESMSHAVLEAMARGKPVVLTDHAGGRELPPSACRVVPAGDAPALAEAISDLLVNRAAREALGREAARIALRNHSLERSLDRLEEILREAAER